MAQKAVHIDGLKEFSRNLKKLDTEFPKELRKALNVAAQIIVDKARPRIPHRSGRAAASLKTASTAQYGRVKAGGKRVLYYPWLEFGGTVGRKQSIHRPRVDGGRYLYPALAANHEDVEQAIRNALVDTARAAGLGMTDAE